MGAPINLHGLEERMCRTCMGKGEHIVTPEDKKKGIRYLCGQCNGWGIVYRIKGEKE